MNPIAQQYAKMHSGNVEMPVLKPVKTPTADLLYRGKPVLQNVSFALANKRKRELLQTGAYVRKFLTVKTHV